MKKVFDMFVKLPKWYGVCIVFIYSLIAAEYMSSLIRFSTNGFENVPKVVSVILYVGHIVSVLISFVIWIIYSYLFYLTSKVLNGTGDFRHFLYVSAYTFIFPSLCIFIAIFMLDSIDIANVDNVTDFLIHNNRFRDIVTFVDLSFLPYYLLNIVFVHYSFLLNWWRSTISVIGPISALFGISKLFELI